MAVDEIVDVIDWKAPLPAVVSSASKISEIGDKIGGVMGELKSRKCRNGLFRMQSHQVEIEPVTGTKKQAKNSHWYMILLTSYWFASASQTSATAMLVTPYQIREMVGEEKQGRYLGVTLLLAAIVTLISGPTSGDFSDRLKLPIGRRRTFLLIGTIFT